MKKYVLIGGAIIWGIVAYAWSTNQVIQLQNVLAYQVPAAPAAPSNQLTFIQAISSQSSTNVATLSTASAMNLGAGNALFVCAATNRAGQTPDIQTPSITTGETFTEIGTIDPNSSSNVRFFVALNLNGGNATVTVTASIASQMTVLVAEYLANPTTTLDTNVNDTRSLTTTNPRSNNFTLAAANQLFASCSATNGTDTTYSAFTNHELRAEFETLQPAVLWDRGSGGGLAAGVYQSTASAGANTAHATITGALIQ